MIVQGRSPPMRHVDGARLRHLDWLFDRIHLDSNISVRCVHTNRQLADFFTNGSFTRDKWNDLLIRFHRNPLSVVAASLVPSATQRARRSQASIDDVSNVRGVSSKANPVGNRAFSLAAMRHRKGGPPIQAQEKTPFYVQSQENQGQASGDRLHSQGTTRNPGSTETVPSKSEEYHWMPKAKVQQQSAWSSAASSKSQIPGVFSR